MTRTLDLVCFQYRNTIVS